MKIDTTTGEVTGIEVDELQIYFNDIDAQSDAEAKIMLDILTAYITKWWGEPCPDYEPECCLCKAWKIVNDFKELNDFNGEKPTKEDLERQRLYEKYGDERLR